MDRRDFIRSAAVAGIAAATPCIPARAASPASEANRPKSFRFRPDGTFKIMQFTDTHYIAGDERSERALKNVIEMLDAVCKAVSVPVIASGGAGSIEDFIELFRRIPDIDAGLAASIFHFGEVSISDLKDRMAEEGIPVRR